MQSQALWYVNPGHVELREEEIAPPKDREVQVRALFGAISRGTERLVYCGGVPATEYERMRGPCMAGQFPFPVKYGYSCLLYTSDAAVVRDRVLERHDRPPDHAICARPGRSRHSDCGSRAG